MKMPKANSRIYRRRELQTKERRWSGYHNRGTECGEALLDARQLEFSFGIVIVMKISREPNADQNVAKKRPITKEKVKEIIFSAISLWRWLDGDRRGPRERARGKTTKAFESRAEGVS
jgi:hypothetical protein